MQPLKGKIAVVAGATRGAGRAIACMLGEAGATVYCTGRTTRDRRSEMNRPETIEESAEMVTRHGGIGIPVRVDHLVEEEVKKLFAQVKAEQGRLDILVNDIWGADHLTAWGNKFWEISVADGLRTIQLGVHSHIITSRWGAPLMVEQGSGLIVEITDGDNWNYRGTLFYDLAKTSLMRLAFAMAEDLRPAGVTALAVTPGFLRSEAMLDLFGVTEENWQEGVQQDPHFIASETPYFVGRAIAALAADPNVAEKAGKTFSSWGLSDEYGFKDIDGRSPHWGRYYEEHVLGKIPA